MGGAAVAAVAGDELVSSIVVADRSLERAEASAGVHGGRASATELDVSDGGALRSALEEVDAVVNTIGPFQRFGSLVLEAAIATGTDYIDICDDWEPTLAALKLDLRARQAGVTAVVGMGSSPGVNNVLSAIALDQLEKADRLVVGWRASGQRPLGEGERVSAAIDHWMEGCSGEISIWRNSGFVKVRPLEEITLDLPGFGQGKVWSVGHPEPLTMPLLRPDLEECVCVMSGRPGMIKAIAELGSAIDNGDLDIPAAGRAYFEKSGVRGKEAGEAAPFPYMFAYAEGSVDGSSTRVVVSADDALPASGGMATATCVPVAACLGLMLRGEVPAKGVLMPERAVVPDRFLGLLAERAGRPSNGALKIERTTD